MFRKPWWLMIPVLVVLAVILTFRHNDDAGGQEGARSTTTAKVIATYPHDPADFCQGLVVSQGQMLEGTGRYGASELKRYALETGEVSQRVPLNANYFGEGITVLNDRIYQLTWKERTCVVYELETLKPVGQLAYSGQGWGLTTDGEKLFMSDGSSVIQVLDPQTLKPIRKIRVTYGRKPQGNLNELEWVEGEIWACIWYEDRIARIDPQTGRVKGYFDCSSLYPIRTRPDREHVLNGIAYDAQEKRLFITGKLWPKIYEVAVPTFGE